MMLVSRPPEATYRELGSPGDTVHLCSVESPLPVVWLVISSPSREQSHLSVAVCCHQIFLVRAVCDIHGGAGEGDLFDEVHAGVGAVDPHRVPAHLPDRQML